MYAIIRSGSKQYKVKKDDVIQVELLDSEPGQPVEFRDVLLIADGQGNAKVGTPLVKGSRVTGQLLQVSKGPKIRSLKYKQRKNQYRKFGHRQPYSQVLILDIQS